MTEIIQSQTLSSATELYMRSWKRSSQLPEDVIDKIDQSERFEDDVFMQSKLFEKYK